MVYFDNYINILKKEINYVMLKLVYQDEGDFHVNKGKINFWR